MDDCLFCKLIAREIPTNIVYEDDDFFAFDDIEPECPIHTLVVPKKHYTNLQDNVPEELLGKLWKVVPEVAKINVNHPPYFEAVDKMLVDVPVEDWKTYLRWHLVNAARIMNQVTLTTVDKIGY